MQSKLQGPSSSSQINQSNSNKLYDSKREHKAINISNSL
uniref:Uncharacterized protein n=1 Tax=Rhizophora mucronata TaxID=61149 RepID=A0A2P2QJN1_RHIMU